MPVKVGSKERATRIGSVKTGQTTLAAGNPIYSTKSLPASTFTLKSLPTNTYQAFWLRVGSEYAYVGEAWNSGETIRVGDRDQRAKQPPTNTYRIK